MSILGCVANEMFLCLQLQERKSENDSESKLVIVCYECRVQLSLAKHSLQGSGFGSAVQYWDRTGEPSPKQFFAFLFWIWKILYCRSCKALFSYLLIGTFEQFFKLIHQCSISSDILLWFCAQQLGEFYYLLVNVIICCFPSYKVCYLLSVDYGSQIECSNYDCFMLLYWSDFIILSSRNVLWAGMPLLMNSVVS